MKKLISVVLLVIMSSAALIAQTTAGRLIGTVAGPDGLLAGATVKLTDNQTKRELTLITNDEGGFTFPQLTFGTYTLTVTTQGFKTYTATDLKIDTGREYLQEVVLEIGSVQENVTIVAGADVLNSTNAELSNTVAPRQVLELPLNGRNPLSLLDTVAGVSATSDSINGQRSSSANYTRDGINIQDNFIRTGGFVQDRPSVDDTGEFTVVTQNAGAELGGGGSTQVQLVTPRGGSRFSGAAFIYNRNSEFSSNPFFNNLSRTGLPFLNRNQYGGRLAGPLPLPAFGEGGPKFLRNKGFFFIAYEGFRLRQQTPVARTVLLPQARNGQFTYVASNGTTQTVNVLTGQNGLSSIPVLSVDPLIQSRILNALPNSGNDFFTGINLLQRLNLNQSDNDNRERVTSRIDVDVNDKNNINFVYSFNKNVDQRTDVDAGGFSATPFGIQGGPTNFYSTSWQSVLSSNLSNEFRFGYQRSEPAFNQVGPLASDFLIGIPLLSNPEPTFRDQGRNTDFYSFQDNLAYTIGNHSLRFGGLFTKTKVEAINLAGAGLTTYNISTAANPNTPPIVAGFFPGGINNTDLARANNLRYLLGGVVGSATTTANLVDAATGYRLGAPQIRRLGFDNFAAYISDQWRVTPQLTLNLGVRYEYFTPLSNPDQNYLEPVINGADPVQAILNPLGGYQLVGGNAGEPGRFFKPDRNNFGPVLSFAYSPDFGKGFIGRLFGKEGRSVIRGGFRVSYVNDENIRSPDNALIGNAGAGSVASTLNNLNARFNNLPNISALPTFNPNPTYAFNNSATFGNFGTVFAVDPNLQTQQTYEYNVGYQRELGFETAIEVRYVGGRSNQLLRTIDYNQINIRSNGFLADFNRAAANLRLPGATTAFCNPATVAGCQALTVFQNGIIAGQTPAAGRVVIGTNGFNVNTFNQNLQNGIPGDLATAIIQANFDNNLLLANPNAGVANVLTNGGKYRYNSLQMEIRKRFSRGLSFQANYTFQKILTDTPGDAQTRVDPYLDNENQRLDFARADYDRTHSVNINFIYELPFGKDKTFLSNAGGFVDRIFGGFQITSLINISSGAPFSIVDNRGVLNRTARSARQVANSSLTGDQIKDLIGIYRTPNGIFLIDPSVLLGVANRRVNGIVVETRNVNVSEQLPAGFTLDEVRGANAFGTTPFAGQVFSPLQPGQSGNLQRAFFNGPNYFNWDASLIKNIPITERTRVQLRMEVFNVLNRANFSTALSQSGNPEFASNPNLFNVNSTNFGRITQTYEPRIVQFAARFEF